MSNDDKGWACVGILVAGVVTGIISSLLNGWVLSILWQWFVVGTFGLKPLTIPAALGLGLLVAMLTYQRQKISDKEETSQLIKEIVYQIITPLFYLGIGYIYHLFM